MNFILLIMRTNNRKADYGETIKSDDNNSCEDPKGKAQTSQTKTTEVGTTTEQLQRVELDWVNTELSNNMPRPGGVREAGGGSTPLHHQPFYSARNALSHALSRTRSLTHSLSLMATTHYYLVCRWLHRPSKRPPQHKKPFLSFLLYYVQSFLWRLHSTFCSKTTTRMYSSLSHSMFLSLLAALPRFPSFLLLLYSELLPYRTLRYTEQARNDNVSLLRCVSTMCQTEHGFYLLRRYTIFSRR